jgi:hypothetical protein
MRIHRTQLMAMRTAPKLRALAHLRKLRCIADKLHLTQSRHVLHRWSFGQRLKRGQKMGFSAGVGTLFEGRVFAELALTEDRFNSVRSGAKLRWERGI